VNVQYRKLNGLRELRLAAGKAQAEIAAALNIRQPSVSKFEKQADMHISTLRSYVEAIGGELELVIRLPRGGGIRLGGVGESEDLRSHADGQSARKRAS
jgi:transcriptional regulator with XRE-family HTH domain